MQYEVTHRTTFDYEQRVSESHHVLHLVPRTHPRQARLSHIIDVDPAPSLMSAGEDYFGNPTHYLTVSEPHERLTVVARSRVDVGAFELAGGWGEPWEQVAAALDAAADAALDASQFVYPSPYVAPDPELRAYAAESFPAERPVFEAALDLTRRIYEDFEYEGGVSDVSTPVGEVLVMRKGVCQDFAHLQIACLRSLGLAARYVSGYLLTYPPEGRPKLVGADASHAWVAIWSPGAGWVDFDPTNNVIPSIEHVTVGWGRDDGDVSPINGFIIGGGMHEVVVAVDVNPAEIEATLNPRP
jgi:transglutaminase-like putative cysteine protease